MCKQSWLWIGCLSLDVTHTLQAWVWAVPGETKHSLLLWRAELKVSKLCGRPPPPPLPHHLSFITVLNGREEEPRGAVHSNHSIGIWQHPLTFQAPFCAQKGMLRAVRWGLLIGVVVRRRVAWRDHRGPQVAGSRLRVIRQACRVGEHVGALRGRQHVVWE